MNHRARVLDAIALHETDRVPVDYWATNDVDRKLLEYFGLLDRDKLLEKLGVDLRYIFPHYIGPQLRTFPDGSTEDIWQVRRRKIETGGAVYEEVSYSPLADAKSIDELIKFHWPVPNWFDYSEIKTLGDKYKKYAIVVCDERTNRTTVLHEAIYLRGIEKIMIDLAMNPDFVRMLFDRISGFYLELNRRIFEASDGRIDILLIGDDLGTQNGLLVSPAMLREFVLPYLKRYTKLCHHFGVKAMFHSCGSIREVIADLIDAGIDILNPIQVQAKGMVPAELKREFGNKICFHGGVDVQQTMPRGTTEKVRSEVRERIEVMGAGGGYILAPTHNFQVDVPVENIVAFYEEAGSLQ